MRHSITLPVIVLAVVSALFAGCMSERDSQELGKAFGEAFSAPFAGLAGARDLVYTAGSFRRKNDRWPKDYAELSAFVQASDGYLYLGKYESVTLTNFPDDQLKIYVVPLGQTNQTIVSLYPPRSK